ncbi:hypothetical protein CONLIGDRAFT_652421 [Coniochaeta ligniaria NRRL 30616]|uniref:Uncharacterized protein n=1 Tax=Coniochaeta ligniaria NRRL 30616 TaxID=1408157 RepID=A0A1J7K1N7_9PEZI|nr:hypothetical protein CONLIGDRAFT_652421 [Coniochaeta ligniaria NRRL 30616]
MFSRILRTAPSGGSSAWASLADRALATQQCRAFSQSQALASSVIHFPKTSSTELDNLLENVRYKVILPSYLPEGQRKRLYNRHYKAQLEADPITMEIDGEKLRFYFTDPVRDVPSTKKSLYDIIDLMKTPDDWAILPRLLEGLCVQAGRKLHYNQYGKLIRRAAMAGCIHTILTCAREVKRTNFKLDNQEIALDVMVNIQVEAILSDWDAAETAKALQRTERVLDMLEEKDHQPTTKKKADDTTPKRTYPLHKDPLILGSRLHMAAAVAAKHNGGVDADGKVAKYAREIVALWPEGKGALALYGEEDFAADPSLQHLRHDTQITYTVAPLLHGFRLAADVVEDQELAGQLRTRAEVLERELSTAIERKPMAPGRRVERVYRKLFPDQNPPVAAEEAAASKHPVEAQTVEA